MLVYLKNICFFPFQFPEVSEPPKKTFCNWISYRDIKWSNIHWKSKEVLRESKQECDRQQVCWEGKEYPLHINPSLKKMNKIHFYPILPGKVWTKPTNKPALNCNPESEQKEEHSHVWDIHINHCGCSAPIRIYYHTVSKFINAGLNSNMQLDALLSASLNWAFNAI